MKVVPLLQSMRAQVSDDGRVARFYLVFKGGLNSAFAIPFNRIGLFLRAIRNTAALMAARLAAHHESAAAEISEGLADPLSIRTLASGRDPETGQRLLWIETVESGPFAFRLAADTMEMLKDIVCQDDTEEQPAA